MRNDGIKEEWDTEGDLRDNIAEGNTDYYFCDRFGLPTPRRFHWGQSRDAKCSL